MQRILLIGYHGFSNSGADARLCVIIDNLRKINKNIKITYVTIDKQIETHADVDVIQIDLLNAFYKLLFYMNKYDIIIIEEGGPYIDFWSFSYIWFFLINICYAKLFQKKIVSYSVGIGKLTPINYRLTKKILNNTNLITSRTTISSGHYSMPSMK